MRSIIGSSGRDCLLIILSQLDDIQAGLFECNLFWIGQYGHFPTLILEEELIKY